MATLATQLYRPTWAEIQQLRCSSERTRLGRSLLGGLLMFLYLALLYISIGLIPTGVAMTLFFTYPIFTALLSWRWFGHRPSLFQSGIIVCVILGSALTMPHLDGDALRTNGLGAACGLASGLTYAFYSVVAQKSFETLHPGPYTWISFATTLLLSGVSLLVWQIHTAQLPWGALWIGGLVSAIVTSLGHLLNNLGIQRIGATSAAMVSATNPALTVVLAWLTIQETLNEMQMTGVVIVTLSVALLSARIRERSL